MTPQPAPPPLVCPECGEWLPALSLGAPCPACLNRRYLRAMLERELRAWADGAFVDVELSRERGRLQHPVMKVEPALTFCGARATESRRKRRRVKLNDLPSAGTICTVCLGNLQRVQTAAAELRRAKGVAT